jgi:prepilin-type N-terminal cleavage/methylation domain-containing protein/prepilin-type processing-associated H-X9-DG protein
LTHIVGHPVATRRGMLQRGLLRGFTLVELIVVIAILAVLAALAFPATSHVLQSSRAAVCISRLSQLGAGLQLYLGDHNQMMPTLENRKSTSEQISAIDNTLNTYVTDPRVFACPADTKGLAAATGTSYFWDNLLNGQSVTHLRFMMSSGENSQIPVLLDKEAFHPYTESKVNTLYADGHASQSLRFGTSQ